MTQKEGWWNKYRFFWTKVKDQTLKGKHKCISEMQIHTNPSRHHVMPLLFQLPSHTPYFHCMTVVRLSFLQTCFCTIILLLLKWHQTWYTICRSSLTHWNNDGRFLSPLLDLRSCLSVHFMNAFPSSALQYYHHSHQINMFAVPNRILGWLLFLWSLQFLQTKYSPASSLPVHVTHFPENTTSLQIKRLKPVLSHWSISGNSQWGSKRFSDKDVHWNFIRATTSETTLCSKRDN